MTRGPDGWRYGIVKWPKSIKPSRLPHYFKNGSSLCGNHYDGYHGFYEEALESEHPALKYPCKACRKKLKGSKRPSHFIEVSVMDCNPLKPQKKTKGSKKIEPLRTPEGESFRRETSKLDNWIYHRRITEYLNGKKPEE